MSNCTDISCGGKHGAAISGNGAVFTWGIHWQFSMVHGVSSKYPTKVSSLPDQKFKQVSCGLNYAAALSDRNELYTWCVH